MQPRGACSSPHANRFHERGEAIARLMRMSDHGLNMPVVSATLKHMNRERSASPADWRGLESQ